MNQYKSELQNSPSLPSLDNKSSLVFTDPRENDRLKKQKTIES